MALARPNDIQLSPRELDVLRAMCRGDRVKQIAHSLEISYKTVGAYRARLFLKLAVNEASSAVWLAAKNPELLTEGRASIRHRAGCRCKACQPMRED